MHALKARPRTTHGRFPDRIDESFAYAEGSAALLWRSLEGRLKDGKRAENRDTCMDIRPRSAEDVAHFELSWRPTGRDVYRFTAW